MREDDSWDPDNQKVTETICGFCGVGCNLELHTQDEKIVKVTSPSDHSVTEGHLCINGRFGWQHPHPKNKDGVSFSKEITTAQSSPYFFEN